MKSESKEKTKQIHDQTSPNIDHSAIVNFYTNNKFDFFQKETQNLFKHGFESELRDLIRDSVG